MNHNKFLYNNNFYYLFYKLITFTFTLKSHSKNVKIIYNFYFIID